MWVVGCCGEEEGGFEFFAKGVDSVCYCQWGDAAVAAAAEVLLVWERRWELRFGGEWMERCGYWSRGS